MRFSRRGGWLLVVAALLGSGLWWAWWSTRPPRMNLLIITLDTTRADRVGSWGGPPGLTPVLDQLAAEGVVFERAFAPVPITLPSHASMMTGLCPPEHGLRVNSGMSRLGSDIPVLAEILKQKSYHTGAFLGAFVLDRKFGLNRGFDYYDDNLGESVDPSVDPHNHRRRDGRLVVDSALTWLKGRGSEPFYCWVHLFDPHTPYRAREELFGDRFRDRPYDAGVAYVDQQAGRLLDFLRQRGLDQRTLVVVAGDHGESLGEHQEREHGFTVYNATTHVPLIVRMPGSDLSARKVSTVVSLVDVFPTALAALGLPVPQCSGRSLLPACHGQELPPVACYTESDRPLDEGGWAPLRCLVTEHWKYIRSPRPELYDLVSDPHERNDLAGTHATELQDLERNLQDCERRFVLRAAPTVVSSPHERRKLASLGYAGGSTVRDADLEGRADIKDMLPHYNAYTDAQSLIATGQFEEAAALLEPVVKATPEYFQAWYNLGVAYQQLKRLRESEAAFGRAVELDGNLWSRLALGKVFLLEGKPEEAIPQFEAAVQIQPEIAEAQYFLGEAYRQTGRTSEARTQYQQALEADPHFSPAKQALQIRP